MVDYLSLISKHVNGEDPRLVPAFIIHSALVTKKALDIAQRYAEKHPDVEIDRAFIEEAGMLHDIGIFQTDTPFLFTRGTGHYLTHLSKGAATLEEAGLPRHAAVARSHSNITAEDIERRSLPLPAEDHVPRTTEEEILYLADLFYTKRFARLFKERSLEEVREVVASYGGSSLKRFEELARKYLQS